MHPVLGLIGWIALVALAAALGTVASVNAAAFYGSLTQPSWAPPAGSPVGFTATKKKSE